jgi:hypothetical protein
VPLEEVQEEREVRLLPRDRQAEAERLLAWSRTIEEHRLTFEEWKAREQDAA